MELKKAKMDEKFTQTEFPENHIVNNSASCDTMLPPYPRSGSAISDLPSPQSVIVKLNNNNPGMVCTVKQTAVNKSAVVVTSLASAVIPETTRDHSPTKSVAFADDKPPKDDPQDSNPITNGPSLPLNISDPSVRDIAL
jgi:hypothetical protein